MYHQKKTIRALPDTNPVEWKPPMCHYLQWDQILSVFVNNRIRSRASRSLVGS